MGRRRKADAITLSDADFARIWSEAENVNAVAFAVGVSAGYCRWRATQLRKAGWSLKRFPRGFHAMTPEQLQHLKDAAAEGRRIRLELDAIERLVQGCAS